MLTTYTKIMDLKVFFAVVSMLLLQTYVRSEKKPPSSCEKVKCPGNQTCTTVDTLQHQRVPICGENPCIEHKCCDVQDGGDVCNDDACYLNFKEGSCNAPGQACQVEPVCKDPCKVKQVKCTKPGEFCYTEKVVCVTSPCPPIPTCRKPCGSQTVCRPRQVCLVIDKKCIGDKNNPKYDPYCKPSEVCRWTLK